MSLHFKNISSTKTLIAPFTGEIRRSLNWYKVVEL